MGADEECFYPRVYKKTNNTFLVFWYGTYIPLHGVNHIIEAAKILKLNTDIKFRLVGSGQTYSKARLQAKRYALSNIEFYDWVSYDELPIWLSEADVCLGIFGSTGKACRVIPNKIFQAIASKKPVISGDTPAMREIFINKENIYLCEIADSKSLSDSILELKEKHALRTNIALNGYNLFKKNFSTKKIGETMKKIISP